MGWSEEGLGYHNMRGRKEGLATIQFTRFMSATSPAPLSYRWKQDKWEDKRRIKKNSKTIDRPHDPRLHFIAFRVPCCSEGVNGSVPIHAARFRSLPVETSIRCGRGMCHLHPGERFPSNSNPAHPAMCVSGCVNEWVDVSEKHRITEDTERWARLNMSLPSATPKFAPAIRPLDP